MKPLRLSIGLVLGAIVMFSLSYLWHGKILNDFSFITYDKNIFLGLLGVLYLTISSVMAIIFMYYRPEENRLFKQFSIGVVFGFIVCLSTVVLGVAFHGGNYTHIAVNFIWQMMEQGIGAFAISAYYIIAHRRECLMEFKDVREEH